MAKWLYLSELQFQPKEDNSRLIQDNVPSTIPRAWVMAMNTGVSLLSPPRCLGHHPLLLCLHLPPTALHPHPGVFLHQQQVLHASRRVSPRPVDPGGRGGGGRWVRDTFYPRASPPRSPLRGYPIHSYPSSSCSGSHRSPLCNFRSPHHPLSHRKLDKQFPGLFSPLWRTESGLWSLWVWLLL